MATFRTFNKFSATSVDPSSRTSSSGTSSTATSCCPGARHRPHVLLPWSSAQTRWPPTAHDDRAGLPRPAARSWPAAEAGWSVFDPRRTETARGPTSTTSCGPAPMRVLLAMLRTLFAEGLTTRRRTSTGWTRWRRPSPTSLREAAARAGRVPAEVIVRVARELGGRDGGVAYGRMGVSTQEFGLVCQWAVQLLNLVAGNTDAVGGASHLPGDRRRGARPAGARALRPVPLAGAPGAGVRRQLPVSVLRGRSRHPGRPGPRLLTIAGNPVLSTPDGAGLDPRAGGPWTLRGGRHLPQRTTRHADVILPPTTLLERDHYDRRSTCWRCATRPASRRRSSPGPRPASRLGDLPRPLPAPLAKRPTGRRRSSGVCSPIARLRLSRRSWSACCCAPGAPGAPSAGCASIPRVSTSARLSPGQLGAAVHQGTGGSRALPALVAADLDRLRAQVLPPATSCCSSAGVTSVTATPGCTTPTGSPGQAAPPPADAPRRPRRPRLADGPVTVTTGRQAVEVGGRGDPEDMCRAWSPLLPTATATSARGVRGRGHRGRGRVDQTT